MSYWTRRNLALGDSLDIRSRSLSRCLGKDTSQTSPWTTDIITTLRNNGYGDIPEEKGQEDATKKSRGDPRLHQPRGDDVTVTSELNDDRSEREDARLLACPHLSPFRARDRRHPIRHRKKHRTVSREEGNPADDRCETETRSSR